MDVAAWLRGLGLEQYEPAFRDNYVDADVLPDLTAEDLIGLGVTAIAAEQPLRGVACAASKLPGSCETVTGCPSRRHQSIPPSSSLTRNPSPASLYAPLVDALQPIPSQ